MIANPKKAEGNTKEEVNEKQKRGGKSNKTKSCFLSLWQT